MCNENLKYELIEEESNIYGYDKVYRVKALKDFGDVKIGELGGIVTDRWNLSQEGDCWIGEYVKLVGSSTRVKDNAVIKGAITVEQSEISGNVKIHGRGLIDKSVITNNATIIVRKHLYIGTDVHIGGSSIIEGNTCYLSDGVEISGLAHICANIDLRGNICIGGNAKIFDNLNLTFDKKLRINNVRDIISTSTNLFGFCGINQEESHITWFRDGNIWYYNYSYYTKGELIEKIREKNRYGATLFEDYANIVEKLIES